MPQCIYIIANPFGLKFSLDLWISCKFCFRTRGKDIGLGYTTLPTKLYTCKSLRCLYRFYFNLLLGEKKLCFFFLNKGPRVSGCRFLKVLRIFVLPFKLRSLIDKSMFRPFFCNRFTQTNINNGFTISYWEGINAI